MSNTHGGHVGIGGICVAICMCMPVEAEKKMHHILENSRPVKTQDITRKLGG